MTSNNSQHPEKSKKRLHNAFESLLSSSHRGIILLDQHHNIVQSNSTAASILNNSLSPDTNLLAVIKGRLRELANILPELVSSKQHQVREVHCRNEDILLEIEIDPLESGSMLYIENISDAQKQTQTIAELARFPEETWNPVMKFSVDGKILYTNKRCGPILDTWETALQQYVPDDVIQQIQIAVSQNKAREVDVLCKTQQIYSILLAPVPEANAVYVYGRDVTTLKQNEQELLKYRDHLESLVKDRTQELQLAVEEADRANKAKSRFLANMSHEIRTPLTAIVGFAESLQDDQLDSDTQDKYLNTIIHSGKHLTKIINDVLDLSKIEAEKIELEKLSVDPFIVAAEVESLIAGQAQRKGLAFKLDYIFPLPRHIETDPIRLRQILINLCGNAIKFTSEGKVTLQMQFNSETQELSFNVIDTGIGINEQQLDKIFSPFTQADASTTRKYGGTGLGLTLSCKLAKLLGGNLKAESTENEGSCFSLNMQTGFIQPNSLTNKLPDIISTQQTSKPAAAPALKGNILLAEDTPELQVLATSFIQKTGADVTLVENGEQAVNAALRQKFDLILMDMQMPVLDGYSAVSKLRSHGYDNPIVAMTANTLKQDHDKAINAGCDHFVGKPIDRSKLYEVLSLYLKKGVNGTSLRSKLLEEEPDLIDLVEKFSQKLPEYISSLDQALKSDNIDKLSKELHVLKGMGGSYGFPMVSEIAEKMETHIRNNNLPVIPSLLQNLREIASRIQAGL